MSIVSFLSTLKQLFIKIEFGLHRAIGALYLVQWLASFFLFFYDYNIYKNSFLSWSLPLNGFLQACNASYFFSFLPRNADPGYYSDKSVMSYKFLLENIFFSGLLFFAAAYMNDTFYNAMQKVPFIENLFVFLPYAVIRPFFPKTRFRDSIENS